MQRTESDVLQMGEYCERLMREQHFNDLCDEFTRGSVTAMLQTEPHETKRREAIYASIAGLKDLLGLMASYVQSAEKIKAQQEAEANPAEEEDADWLLDPELRD